MFLTLLSYAGMAMGFLFLIGSIASALYNISEQVEEHTVLAKWLLVRIIYTVIAIHVFLLLFDNFPVKITIFSIGAHTVYLQNLREFPLIQLASVTFTASCALVVACHLLWLSHFTEASIPPHSIYIQHPQYQGATHPPISEVVSFLGICVWLVPLALFLSLSASDNVLPTMADGGKPGKTGKPQRTGLAKVAVRQLCDVAYNIAAVVAYIFEAYCKS